MTPNVRTHEVETPRGPARIHVHRAQGSDTRGTVVLGHGAGGQGWPGDLRLLADELPSHGWTVVLVEQPWRVAGKKVATPPRTLDEAWVPVLATITGSAVPVGHAEVAPHARMGGSGRLLHVRTVEGGGVARPLVVGGRSAGARVACRTAVQTGADAVLCLSFPLHPPGKPEKSRADELRTPIDAGLPTHVIQGERDPFGRPDEVRAEVPSPAYVTAVSGAHSFGKDPRDVLDAALGFLTGL